LRRSSPVTNRCLEMNVEVALGGQPKSAENQHVDDLFVRQAPGGCALKGRKKKRTTEKERGARVDTGIKS